MAPGAAAADRAVEVEQLTVAYGQRVAVDGISFSANKGEVLAVLGPNGAGKTTTVETLEGYRHPNAGRVRVLGLDPRGDRTELVLRIGVMLQRGGLYPMMNAEQALRLFEAYYPNPRSAGELLDLVGLSDVARTPYKRLSGGEQQRLALGLAIIGRPEVAFLDEPTAGVDPAGRVAIRQIIAALRADGVCVVLTSHELDEVERLADRVVIIDHGHIVAEGRPDEITEEAVVRFSSTPGLDVAALSSVLGTGVVEASPGLYELDGSPSPAAVAALAAWLAERDLALGSFEAGRESLEDVFMRLLRGSAESASPSPAGSAETRPGRRRAGR